MLSISVLGQKSHQSFNFCIAVLDELLRNEHDNAIRIITHLHALIYDVNELKKLNHILEIETIVMKLFHKLFFWLLHAAQVIKIVHGKEQ